MQRWAMMWGKVDGEAGTEVSMVGARLYERVRSQWLFGWWLRSDWRVVRGFGSDDGVVCVWRIWRGVCFGWLPRPARMAVGLCSGVVWRVGMWCADCVTVDDMSFF